MDERVRTPERNLTSLAPQAFDAEAFGAPFFRVTRFDPESLDKDLEAVRALPRAIVDAAVMAGNRDQDRYFQTRGFKKACTQIRFEIATSPDDAGIDPAETTEDRLGPDGVARHIDNLTFDRFNLDADIRKPDRDRFQRMWLTNSMRAENILKLYDRQSFASFKRSAETLVVDVFSVLDHRRGVGSALMTRLKAYAARENVPLIQVTTECENLPACLFYQKHGMRIGAFVSRFHLVRY